MALRPGWLAPRLWVRWTMCRLMRARRFRSLPAAGAYAGRHFQYDRRCDSNFNHNLAEANGGTRPRLRNDLASALGGEVTLALDGQSFHAIVEAIFEVNNSGGLQLAIDKLVQSFNRQAQKSNQPGLTLNQTQLDGRTFYTIELQAGGPAAEFDYTFADGSCFWRPRGRYFSLR